MSRIELRILYTEGGRTKLRVAVNKWKFQDSMMGEQFITLTVTSEKPIAWAVGDYCEFRGVRFTLNYVPSVVQKARTREVQDAYTYENVKFESQQEELSRCLMLDITLTTGEYVPALGTNYTGSSKFQLFCGETTVNGSTLTAVCALAAKMQANLDRMYGTGTWSILVDTESTYTNASGQTVLVTHTEDKVLSFDNTTVAQALAEVHNTFDLDYCVRGRNIFIGYNLSNLTSDNDFETFAFGYGKGYPTREDSGKALFQIKRISNQQQKLVTRLRALGSTKNLPYRYYNKKYNLSQALFPTNLQLPDTFETPSVKVTHNADRDNVYGINPLSGLPYLRHVKGETNDAYIDKNDDAEGCAEGVREESARWDGSNGDLPEIYPTIEEATYGELRGALVEDQDGNTGVNSFPGYGNDERIDELLAIGYKDGGVMVDDANQGDGILPDSGTTENGITRSATVEQTSLYYANGGGDFENKGGYYAGGEKTLFSIPNVQPGRYAMVPTGPSYNSVIYGFVISYHNDSVRADVGYQIKIYQRSKDTNVRTVIATYTSDCMSAIRGTSNEMSLPELPDVKEGSSAKVTSITVTETSDIIVTFAPIMRNIVVPSSFVDDFALTYKVGKSTIDTSQPYDPEYTWKPLDDSESQQETFHVFIKDMGFDITACWTSDTPTLAMKSGRCVGREFEIGENVEKVTYNGRKGYMLTLHRAKDSSLNTYYPNENDTIAAGDNFVLLNINMPEVYIKMAEVRLLRAATDYLADNCETQFTYQPYIDDIYLQRNYDRMLAAGTPQKSIFWRLYAGLKFTFRGIPSRDGDPLPLVELTIEQVSISMGDGLTPKVEMTLNDDVQQTTLQKLTTSVDRIYNGSLFSNGAGGGGLGVYAAALLSILQADGGRLFLSKRTDDTANGRITFKDGLKSDADAKFGSFVKDVSGAGIWQDEHNNWHIEGDYLHARKKLTAKELEIEEIRHVGGRVLLSSAEMVCSMVEEHPTYYRCLFLKEDSDGKKIYNKFKVGDQAIMQSFNEGESENDNANRFFWRLVTGTGSMSVGDSDTISEYHFIDLSKTDCASNSDAPQAGDKIVQLGYRYDNDAERQNAIMLAGAGTGSPYIDEYVGVNSYSLEGKCKTRIKPGDNFFTGKFELSYDSTLGGESLIDLIGNTESITEIMQQLEQMSYQLDQVDNGLMAIINDIDNFTSGNENLLRNTGFTGDYETMDVSEEAPVSVDNVVYSDPLKYWESSNASVVADINSSSGFAVVLNGGYIEQETSKPLVDGDWYNVSFRASGTQLTLSVDGYENAILLTNEPHRYCFKFKCSDSSASTFSISNATARVMEIQLCAGSVPNADWIPSPLDNPKVLAYYQNLTYLANSIVNANTQILGGLILSQMIRVGNYRNGSMVQETGGMSGIYTSEHSPFIWGGGTMEQAFYTIAKYAADPSYQATQDEVAQMAKFVVTHGGRAILNDIVLRGYIYALGGYFKGTVEATSGLFKNILSPNGAFKIDNEGNLECSNAKLSGNLYMPLFEINGSNWQHYLIQQEVSQGVVVHNLRLDLTGLNVHLKNLGIPGTVTIVLPTAETFNGAKAHIFNWSGNDVVISGAGGGLGNIYNLAEGEFGIFFCYHANNDNYYWWKIN